MKRNLLIELLEDGEKVSLYSPHFEGEDYSEFEKFLLNYKDAYPDDVRQLVYRLDIIKRDGARDMHFRYEGTRHDRVMALPFSPRNYFSTSFLAEYSGKDTDFRQWRIKTDCYISGR